jgi:predicted nucleic acid-binding protein
VNAYVDTSVILRIVLKAPQALTLWRRITTAVASRLLQVECLRAVERLRLTGEIDQREARQTHLSLQEAFQRIELLHITDDVLTRAGEAFGAPIKTLDAIHLATAIAWRERYGGDLLFATHDHQLATAAGASGFTVLGV